MKKLVLGIVVVASLFGLKPSHSLSLKKRPKKKKKQQMLVKQELLVQQVLELVVLQRQQLLLHRQGKTLLFYLVNVSIH
jgi:hypothetical protein